ncbi:zf-PARP-domain-containing protein [Gymnopus androsaceus JB14]|uniref:Zf-PARP-domain-containing protein n=1 Tax=Gymnopus androsaceus JB14 TaxID=1447944 RepID=A0A6A4I159_9AGAR|nr:zf-PARP-domain-containing protein [Gymnopus androsaceus JB14]
MPGYRLEYASTSRAKCKGPKPCGGTIIPKGGLRLGSTVDFNGKQSFAWRHWGCATAKVIANIKGQFPDASDVDGFEDLNEEDQAKIIKAWEDGHVADEDIPESARKADA